MEAYNFCQSCGRPLDRSEVLGTEKDGSKSTIYCIVCYREGEFTQPELTLEEMQHQVRSLMEEMHLDEEKISRALERMPYLSRWFGIPAIHHFSEWH
jgi:hypothetical protein